MDQKTIERIQLMHPSLREELTKQYNEINNILPIGVRLRFSHTLRTVEEQNALYNQGRTTSGKKVTNAKGGQSIHNYGLAFDICILLDTDKNGSFESVVWEGKYFNEVVAYFKSKGWEWGGDWIKFKDKPHFQVKGSNWRDLANKLKKDGYPIL